jgi:hypothetical protein
MGTGHGPGVRAGPARRGVVRVRVHYRVLGIGHPQYVLLAGIHYLASLVPIVVTHLVLIAPVGKFGSLFLVGTNVSIVYNIAAAMEESVSEWMLQHDPR